MKNRTYYIELASRWHVFLLLNTYGWGKLLGGQFYRKDNLPEAIANQTLATVNSFDLAWTFMGHSPFYIAFIGISQIIGAWMLIFNKTKLIGVAVLLPILLNIIVFDALFFDTYGALASACIYLLLLFTILYLNKEQVIAFIKVLLKPKDLNNFKTKPLKTLLIVIVLIAVIFGIEQGIVNILGH